MASDRFLTKNSIPEDLPTLELDIEELKQVIEQKTLVYEDLKQQIEEFRKLSQSENENIPPLKAVALMADRLAPKFAALKQLQAEKGKPIP